MRLWQWPLVSTRYRKIKSFEYWNFTFHLSNVCEMPTACFRNLFATSRVLLFTLILTALLRPHTISREAKEQQLILKRGTVRRQKVSQARDSSYHIWCANLLIYAGDLIFVKTTLAPLDPKEHEPIITSCMPNILRFQIC